MSVGSWRDGLFHAIDHPVYPIGVAMVHGLLRDASPEGWQASAQCASVLSAVLLVLPVYLIGAELFGEASAWLGVIFFMLLPRNNHVFADALSESTFLLFWSWGLWSALRYLREGKFAWLPLTLGFAAAAYLTRPEGLLLPLALLLTLLAIPLMRSTRIHVGRWWTAVAVFLIGGACAIGPYVAIKGGLGSKPAIARILGTAERSPPSAVEARAAARSQPD